MGEIRLDTDSLVHYQTLKGNGYSGSTQEFSDGVHQITMRCIRSHPNDKFGIVENVNVDTLTDLGRIYLYNPVFKTRYYWWKHTHNIWRGSNYFKKIDNLQWKNGDTIKMIIDCEKWTCQFLHTPANEENEAIVLAPFPIKPNIKYFPILSQGDTKSEYRHIFPKSFSPL